MTEETSSEPSERRIAPVRRGRYFEDLRVGTIYKHPHGRTITETDNVWFALITLKQGPLHVNEEYAGETEFGERILDGTFLISVVVGLSAEDMSQHAIANLGFEDIAFHAPVFHGDTVYAESEVISRRESASREDGGIVTLELRGYKQDNTKVVTIRTTLLIQKHEYANGDTKKPPEWPAGVGTQESDL